jgi:low affinity Fe/Cu permease
MERRFEQVTDLVLKVFGSSISFFVALVWVIIYLCSRKFYKQDFHDCIRDVILCLTFLSFFMLQKWYNKFYYSLHIKMNEMIATHDKASNRMVNVEEKTEAELRELAKYYSELARRAKHHEDIHAPHSIETILKERKEERRRSE